MNPICPPGAAALTAVAARLWGGHAGPQVPAADLLACARDHRVHLLLAGTLDPRDASEQELWSELRDEYRDAAVRDAAETAALQQLLAVASAHGVRPLLLKGAALAHRVYERSWERPRSDIDLLIAESDAPALCRALEVAGYERAVAVDGALVTRQFQYVRSEAGQLDLQVDVHTRVFNPAAFADALGWEEADARAVGVPALGPAARTLSDADALLVACLHRVAHHHDAPDLIWICDIDRLARRLDEDAWTAFASSATRARVCGVCRSSLDAAAELFGTPVPAMVSAALAAASHEPSASFLECGAGELHVQWLNFRHLTGWQARAALVSQHVFPSRDYMRLRYGVDSRWVLPLCYAHRVCVGLPRWLRAQRS